LLLAAFTCFGFFGVALGIRSFGLEGLVSQVFKHSTKTHLIGRHYAHIYNVAVTPTDRIVAICDLITLTSGAGLNLLEKKVYLWPADHPTYAYHETPESRIAMVLSLVTGVLLLWVSIVLFFKKS
jgi:hypothetical protein